MEIEYKFRACPGDLGAVLALFGAENAESVAMRALYYDDAGGTLGKNKTALRFRTENGAGIVTVKRKLDADGALARRDEWECSAPDLASGLAGVYIDDENARGLVALAAGNGLRVIAEMSFERRRAGLTVPGAQAELAFDRGLFNGKEPFCEVELELKGGSAAALEKAARRLELELGLSPEPLSKLARALKREM